MRELKIKAVYRHFKGKYYFVEDEAFMKVFKEHSWGFWFTRNTYAPCNGSTYFWLYTG